MRHKKVFFGAIFYSRKNRFYGKEIFKKILLLHPIIFDKNRRFMGLFSFLTKEVAIDLGTANTIIIYNDKVVVDEPSIVAVQRSTGKVMAVGRRAQMMHGRTHSDIQTIRPLQNGVIADFNSAEYMIREFIKKIPTKSYLPSSLKMIICIPSGITPVEERAVKDSAEQAGAKEVKLIHEPMAAAIGIGLDVLEPNGNMVIDIGGGTSEIAVIALGGIVNNESIDIAGDEFNADIIEYMRKQHNINIGERSAEQVKIEVGAALTELENEPPDTTVHGRDVMTGIPREVTIGYQEIAACLDKSISKMEQAVLRALEKTPPELSADIYRTGIYLAGGGALLRGLDKRLQAKTELQVHVTEDPLRAVARGTGIALKNFNKFPFLIK